MGHCCAHPEDNRREISISVHGQVPEAQGFTKASEEVKLLLKKANKSKNPQVVITPLRLSKTNEEVGQKVESMNDIHAAVQMIQENLGPAWKDPELEKLYANLPTIGPIRYTNGATYQGKMKDDKREGFGTFIWQDGSIYEGYWKDNKPSGAGRILHIKGDYYIGDWVNGKAEGEGNYVYSNGTDYYQGNWFQDCQKGKGTLFRKEDPEFDGASTMYIGDFVNFKREGKGKIMSWQDGDTEKDAPFVTYEGDMHEDMMQGNGKLTFKDGRVYVGEFVNNEMEGQGEFRWPDGRYYIGEYRNNKKHGRGKFRWKNGDIYDGYFVNGKQEGFGEQYTAKDGITRKGYFRHGQNFSWVDEDESSDRKRGVKSQQSGIPDIPGADLPREKKGLLDFLK